MPDSQLDMSKLTSTLTILSRRISRGQGVDIVGHQLLKSLLSYIPKEDEGLSQRDRAVLQSVVTPVMRKRRQPYRCEVGDFLVVWVSDKPGCDIWWLARAVDRTSLTVTVEYEGKLADSVCAVSLLQWQWCAASMPLWSMEVSEQTAMYYLSKDSNVVLPGVLPPAVSFNVPMT